MALTIEQIARFKNMPGRHSDGHGLCLQVINRNNVSWLFRYERGGRERWMGLGPLHTITLKEARELARDARKLLLAGKDPLDMRRQERTAIDLAAARTTTFADAARQYHEHHADKWDNAKHKAQFLSSLEQHIFPVIGSLPVADIDTPAVLRALEPIWKKIPETASRLRGRVERVLSFATIRGYRQGENPARWRGHLGEMLATRKAGKVKHHRALPFAEMPTFMAALAEREGMSARAMEFLILTAARTGEVVSCRWSEIDLDAKLWTIPADRMKAGKAHRVPLSDRALAILRALPRESDFVFVGQRKGTSISDAALLQVLKRMERTDFVVHGLRSSFRDWCAEKTTYAHHIIESALAHAVGSKTERAYLRSDLLNQRVSLMQDWAGYLYAPPSRGGVVPIRRRRV